MNADLETWLRALEVLGVWSAAIATFYAARTALRISLRASRRLVSVRAGGAVYLGDRKHIFLFTLKHRILKRQNKEECLQSITDYTIVVSNTGQVPVVIDEVGFTHILMKGWRTPFNTEGACTLQPGEKFDFICPRPDFTSLYFSEGNVDYRHWIRRLISLCTFARVGLASGEVFKARVSEPIREALWKDMQNDLTVRNGRAS